VDLFGRPGFKAYSIDVESKRMKAIFVLTMWLFVAGVFSSSARGELKPGDPAPDFELKGSDGKTYKLADLKDKQAIVIAWFPKAFTGG